MVLTFNNEKSTPYSAQAKITTNNNKLSLKIKWIVIDSLEGNNYFGDFIIDNNKIYFYTAEENTDKKDF